MEFLLFYEKVPDYAERQIPWQTAHREHVEAAATQGDLLLAGSMENPTDGSALLVFRTETPAPAEAFARTDPYVIHGVISRWWIRPWDVVAGTLARVSVETPRN